MATGPVQNNRAVGALTAQTSAADKATKAQNARGDGVDGAKTDESVAKSAAGVSISPAAKERAAAQQKAMDIAVGTPDIREDRVAELKAQIASGTYKIDSGKIADGMLREAIREHLALND